MRGMRKKHRPIWDEAIERPRSPSGVHDINKKQPTGTIKKRKGDHRSRGVSINFPTSILLLLNILALLFLNTPKLKQRTKIFTPN